MTLPIGREDDFVGVVDVLSRQAYVWDDTGLPENYEIKEIPADMVDDVETYREEMIETAVEQDDDLMEAYMEGEELLSSKSKLVSVKVHVITRSSLHTVVLHSKTKVCS